jgi:hypothetical protein
MAPILPILALGTVALVAFLASHAKGVEHEEQQRKALDAIRAVLHSSDPAALRQAAAQAASAGFHDEAVVLAARADSIEQQVQTPAPAAPHPSSAATPAPAKPTPAAKKKPAGVHKPAKSDAPRKLTDAEAETYVRAANASEDPHELATFAAQLEAGGWKPLADAIRTRAARPMTGEERTRLQAHYEFLEADDPQNKGAPAVEVRARAKAHADLIAAQRDVASRSPRQADPAPRPADPAPRQADPAPSATTTSGPPPGPAHPSVPTPSQADYEKAARAAFQRAMKSDDPKAVGDIAAMLRETGFTGLASDLDKRAKDLRAKASTSSPAPSGPTPTHKKPERPVRDYDDLPAAPVPHADPAKEKDRANQAAAARLVTDAQRETDPVKVFDLAQKLEQLDDKYASLARQVEQRARDLQLAQDTTKKPPPAQALDATGAAALRDRGMALGKATDTEQAAQIASVLYDAGFAQLGDQVQRHAEELAVSAIPGPSAAKVGAEAVQDVAQVLRSPFANVPDDAWSRFVGALAVGRADEVTPNNRIGLFRYSVRRLDTVPGLNLVRNSRKDERDQWIADWVPPRSLGEFLSSPDQQLAVFIYDMRHLRKQCERYAGWIGRPTQLDGKPVTLSGLLAVAQSAGPQGLYGWLTDGAQREKFQATTNAYLRANGLF